MERAAGPDTPVGQPEIRERPGSDTSVLEELRFHWGEAYDIRSEGGQCTARRRDGKGGTLADPLPEGLRLRIVADYSAMPVPRDLP